VFLFGINGVLYLGFLKFLKRDKRKEPDLDLKNLGDLDVPPLPPDLDEKGFGGEELPELPELPEFEGEGPISSVREKPSPELKIEKSIPELRLPGMESQKSIGGLIPEPPQPKPLFGMQKPGPIHSVLKPQEEKPEVELPIPKPKITPYERFGRAAIREERSILKHKEAEGPIFIRIERFRNILAETRGIKNSGETIYLYDNNGKLIDKKTYNKTTEDLSWAYLNNSLHKSNPSPGYEDMLTMQAL